MCRAWRDALAEPALWTRLDLSRTSGVSWRLNANALLRGAAARAQGQLYHLDVSECFMHPRVLLEVVAASAGSLRELRVAYLSVSDAAGRAATLNELVAAAPLLQALAADKVWCTWEDAPALLRADPPWAPLPLRALRVSLGDVAALDHVGPFAALLADAALQPALSELTLCDADISRPDVLGALVDAALARRLQQLSFSTCPPPAPAPLARLLLGGSLSHLGLLATATAAPLFDAAGAALVADALRRTTTLTSLNLCGARLCRDMDAAQTLLGALVGHPSLRELELSCEQTLDAEERETAVPLGAALAALVAADAPALQELDIVGNDLGDAGLAPLAVALPRNRHLRTLKLRVNGMSERFARERLLPAVQANTSLREFWCASEPPAAVEAEELVTQRALRTLHS